MRLPRRLQRNEAAQLVDHLGELRGRIVVSLVAWSFVAPALDEKINRAIGWLVVSAATLFAAGAAFGLRVALPAAVHFLTNYDSTLYNIQIRAADFYSFAIMVLVASVFFEKRWNAARISGVAPIGG